MHWKYFLVNKLYLNVNCKIYFIDQFFLKYFTGKNMNFFSIRYFSKTNNGKSKIYSYVKYFTPKKHILKD